MKNTKYTKQKQKNQSPLCNLEPACSHVGEGENGGCVCDGLS